MARYLAEVISVYIPDGVVLYKADSRWGAGTVRIRGGEAAVCGTIAKLRGSNYCLLHIATWCNA